jgi:biotin carboxylase
MSKILILGGGKAQAEFVEYCLSKGHVVYLLDGNKEAYANSIENRNLHPQLVDITLPGKVLEFAKNIIPDAVIAPSNDAGLEAATMVAEHFGIPGPGVYALQNSRNKFNFRKLLEKNSINSPWYFEVSSTNSEDAITKVPNYPCVIKPVQGSGSKGVRFLESSPDLSAYFKESFAFSTSNQYQIEEFIDGVEFSIEGVVQDGDFTILAVCEKVRSKLPNLVDTRVSYPPRLTLENLQKVHQTASEIVKLLQVQNAPIHMEIIQSPTRGFFPVECAVRAAGFNLFNRMVPWCIGIDTLSLQLSLILGEPLGNLTPTRQYAGVLDFPQPPGSGELKTINYQEPQTTNASVEIEIYSKIGDLVKPTSNGAERIGHIFIFSETLEQAEETLNLVNLTIEIAKPVSREDNPKIDSVTIYEN